VKINVSKIFGCATHAFLCSLCIGQDHTVSRSCSSPDVKITIVPHQDFIIPKGKRKIRLLFFSTEPGSSENTPPSEEGDREHRIEILCYYAEM